jgi:hypothetical protein
VSLINAGTHGSRGIVSGGRLVAHAPNPNVATYIQAATPLGGTVVGARMTFSALTEAGGTSSIGFWAAPMDSDTGTAVVDSPCHCTVSPTSWALGTFTGGVLTNHAVGTLSLTADGVTEYTAECVLDSAAACVYLTVREAVGGRVMLATRVAAPAMGTNQAAYAYWEHYRTAVTHTLPAFSDLWFSDGDSAGVRAAAAALGSASAPAVLRWGTTSASPGVGDGLYTAPTGSSAAVDAANIALPFVPRGTRALVTVTAYVKFFQNVDYFWTIRNGGTTLANTQVAGGADAAEKPQTGMRTVQIVLTGLTPGGAYTLTLGHLATISNGAILHAVANGSSSRPLTMTAIDA